MVRIVGLLWVVVIAIVVAFAYFASSLCITFLLASFLALALRSDPDFLERFRIPRVISTGCSSLWSRRNRRVRASYGRANQIIEDLPDYAERIHEAFEPINQRIEQVQKSAGSITASAPSPITKKSPPMVRVADQPAPAWPSYLIRGVGSVWGAVIVGGIVPFLMFFMLVRKSHLYGWTGAHIWRNGRRAEFHVDADKNGARICRRQLDHRHAMAAVMVGSCTRSRCRARFPLASPADF